MSAQTFSEISYHLGHHLEVAIYGNGVDNPTNAAIECVDCYTVLLDFDKE